MSSPTRATQLASLAALACFGALGCGSAVVGAECAPGQSRCGDRCFDLENDPDHCGACDRSCGRFECRDAQCGPGLRPDADGGSSDGGVLVVGGPPFLPDGGFAFPDVTVGRGCMLGESTCGASCVDLDRDDANCGECGATCPPGQYCHDGECMMCTAPLQLCDGRCVDLQSDVNNCGRCGHVCRSGICEDGVCADLLTGHLVLVGHDYSGGRGSGTAMRLLGNAVFLATGSPVRTLVYEGSASGASVDGVAAAIDYVVERDGRSWAPISVAADDLGAELRQADALLVHAQVGSSDDALTELGQRIGLAMSQFLLRGGVIVVIEAPSTSNAGTFRLLQPAGLFEAAAREAIPAQTLEVSAPGDGLAARTTRSYRSPNQSVRFVGVTSPGIQVARDRDGETVVLHRVVVP